MTAPPYAWAKGPKTIDQKKRAVSTRPFGREATDYSLQYHGLHSVTLAKTPHMAPIYGPNSG